MAKGLAQLIQVMDLPVPALGGDMGNSTLPRCEDQLSVPSPLNTIFAATAAAESKSRLKSFAILVSTAITFAAAAQQKIQLTGSRKPYGSGSGATSPLPSLGDDNSVGYLGASTNWLASTANIATGLYWIEASLFPACHSYAPYVGLEFQFSAAPTAGVISAIYVDWAPL